MKTIKSILFIGLIFTQFSQIQMAQAGIISNALSHILFGTNDLNIRLFDAAGDGNYAKVITLLDEGADAKAKSKQGVTAVHLAAVYGHSEVVKPLIKAGADIEAKSKGDFTALFYAVVKGHPEAAIALIDEGANVEVKNKNGNTALHLGASKGQPETTKVLIARGADIEARDKNGNTALHYTAMFNHSETALVFIDAGADVDAKNNKGDTAVDIAYRMKNFEVFNLLEKQQLLNAEKQKATAQQKNCGKIFKNKKEF